MIHGVLNVYKEKGYTSHDVVAKLRGITKQKKIGHTGTLDPDAEGVLPVCFGRATKLCDLLTDKDKTYIAEMLLGKETDTQDLGGCVLNLGETDHLTEKEVEKTILSFVGTYDQIPPMYSALKVNGKKLYELAREGKVIERKPRRVEIKEIRILSMKLPRVQMEITCSKGTYIRTLCHDIGEKLGCHGCMSSLIRSRVSQFLLEDSLKLEEISQKMTDHTLMNELIPIDFMFLNYKKVYVLDSWESFARNGNILPEKAVICEKMENTQIVRIYDMQERFIALYKWKKQKGEFYIEKMFFPEVIDGDKRCAM